MDGLIGINMKNTILLLAGYPGTGKSYMANMLIKRFPEFELLSPDQIKEKNWDKYGFADLNEKEKLILLSWDEYYKAMENMMKSGHSVLSDYPFSIKQKDNIAKRSSQYDFQTVTIRLTGDLEILYQRQAKRDLDPKRHPGHVMRCYRKSDAPIMRNDADNLLSHAEFIKRCTERGYGSFSLGRTIEIDVTDFSKIDYEKLYAELDEILEVTNS